MDKPIKYPILPEEKCLSEEQLFRYIDGKLSAAEMHQAETHLIDCGFCSDALDGLQLVENREKAALFFPVAAVTENAAIPTENKKEEPKVIPLFQRKATWYSIAASVVLLLGLVTVMKLGMNNESMVSSKDVAQNNSAMSDSSSLPGADQTVNSSAELTKEEKTGANNQTAVSSVVKKADANVSDGYFAEAKEESAAPIQFVVPAAEPEQDDAIAQTVAPVTKSVLEDENQSSTAGGLANADTDDDSKNNKPNDKASGLKDKIVETVTRNEAKQAGSTPNRASSYNDAPSNSGNANTSKTDVISEEQTVHVATDSMATSTQSNSGPYPNKASSADIQLSYDTGVEMLSSGKAQASLVFFDEVLKHQDHARYQDAQWKKAEALILLNRKEEAKVLLNQLASKSGTYQQQAKDKLKTL
jgi:hypothetical protein